MLTLYSSFRFLKPAEESTEKQGDYMAKLKATRLYSSTDIRRILLRSACS